MNTFNINLCRFQHKFQNAFTYPFFPYLIYLSTHMLNLLRFITQLIVYSISLPILINYYCQEKSAKAICFSPQNSWGILKVVPKCSVMVQIFWASPKLYLLIVPVTNILCQKKWWFAFNEIVFCAGTKVFEDALNAVKFLGWLKKFGLAQNILGPVKGQGIRLLTYLKHHRNSKTYLGNYFWRILIYYQYSWYKCELF